MTESPATERFSNVTISDAILNPKTISLTIIPNIKGHTQPTIWLAKTVVEPLPLSRDLTAQEKGGIAMLFSL